MALLGLPVGGSTSVEDLVAAFRECFASMIAFGSSLSEDDWNQPSLCPGWRAKDALVHVTAAETAFFSWTDHSAGPFEAIKAEGRLLRDRSGADILAAFESVTSRRIAQLETMPASELDAVGWLAGGTGPYRRYMEIRVFDHWAHEQDIRVPLGQPGHLEGRAASISLDEVHLVFGYLVGKRAATPDGASVTLRVTGPQARDLHAVVQGRARVVTELTDPTATVETDFLTAMLLACGRIDPSGPLGDGRITLRGDLVLAERVARNLAFTL